MTSLSMNIIILNACVLPVYSGNVGADVLVFVIMTQHQTEL